MSDSKFEFLKHLRTVHFGLVVTAFTLLIAVLNTEQTDADKAFEQLVEIQSASAKWSSGRFFQVRQGESWLHLFPSTYVGLDFQGDGKTEVSKENTSKTVVFNSVSTTEQIEITPTIFTSEGPGHFGTWYAQVLNVQTLDRFKQLWDEARTRLVALEFVEVLDDAMVISDPSFSRPRPNIDPNDDVNSSWYPTQKLAVSNKNYAINHSAMIPDLLIYPMSYSEFHEQIKEQNWGSYYIAEGNAPGKTDSINKSMSVGLESGNRAKLIVSVRANVKEIDGFKLFNRFFETSWPDVDFESAFPELVDITQGYSSASLDEIMGVLKSERERQGSQFEALGLKVPISAVGTWGTFLLLIIQLYFFLHLSEFVRTPNVLRPDLNFPWIGYYDDRTARLLFWVSVAPLPTVAHSVIAFFVIPTLTNPLTKAGASVAIIGGIAVSVMTGVRATKIWRKNQT